MSQEERQLQTQQKPSNFDPYPFNLIRQMTGIISLGHRLRLLSQQVVIQRDIESKSPEYEKLDDIVEIAHVEGYDDGSYIISSLKDIKRRLSNNEFEKAMTKIRQLLNDVMPFDYLHFFQLFKATKDTAKRLEGTFCVSVNVNVNEMSIIN